MKREKREVWIDRVRRWRESGLSAREFAAQEGCHAKTLQVWRWQLKQRRQTAKAAALTPAAPAFVEVVPERVIAMAASVSRPQAATLPFEVTLPGGARVVVPANFEHRALAALVELLGGR